MANTPKGLKVAKEDKKANRHDGHQAEMGRDSHSELWQDGCQAERGKDCHSELLMTDICDSRFAFATEKSDLKTISPTYNTTPETGLSVSHEMIGTFLLTN